MLPDVAVPSRLQQGAILVLAAALVAAGVGGGQWFMEADYVIYGVSGKSEWTVDAGYTVGEFWGLVFQTLCLPAAAVALMSFSLHSYKSSLWPSWVKLLGYAALLVILAVCASIANDTMTDGLVECLWSFCEDASTSSSEAFTAFIPTIGTTYFIVLVIFACMAGLLFLRTAADLLLCFRARSLGVLNVGSKEESQPLMGLTPAVTGTGEDPSESGHSSGALRPISPLFQVGSMEKERRIARRRVSIIWLASVFCVFFPVFVFASMAFNNGWTGMTVSAVQSYASSSITQAYGKVWNLSLSSSLILKLFPDVLIYWSFMYLVVVVALVARGWKPLGRFFHTPFRLAGHVFGLKNGEVFLVVTFLALLISEALYWFNDHGWDSTAVDERTWQDRLARTLGQLANITMGLMILPVSRNGVFQKVFGLGWEAMIAYHRWMARAFLAIVLLHMVLFWNVFAQNGDFWHDWPVAIPTDYHSDNWTIPLTTITTWVTVIVMFGLSLEWVRRQHFNLFYYSHHFFLVVWAVMMWHAASAWYYIGASIALWMFDRAIRFSKGLTMVSVKTLTSWGGVTRLSYTVESGGIGPWGGLSTGMLHEAGQYAFVNVPAISLLEWHPFTISSCPDDAETTHHIKDMGPKTFTGRLRMLATLGTRVEVNVDGPYGVPVEYNRYRLLVLVAGGIGITPCVSLVRHLNRLSRAGHLADCLDEGVRLVWTTRSVEEMVMLERELQEVAGEDGSIDGRFSIHLHLTSAKTNVGKGGGGGSGGDVRSARTCLPYTQGRPDLVDYFAKFGRPSSTLHQQHQQQQRRGAALVFACGPTGLVKEASRAAGVAGMEFHSETFEV